MDKVLATEVEDSFDPQDPHETKKVWCPSSIPELIKQRQGIPGKMASQTSLN